MRSIWVSAVLLSAAAIGIGQAQDFELGALAGFAWDHDASIRNPSSSVEAGFKPGFMGGALFGENHYHYIGGEIRWLFRVGGPQLTAPGIKVSAGGFTNLIHYDLLVHLTRKEEHLRPFLAAGAGIKVFTGPDHPDFRQPLQDFAFIAHGNHVEPLISAGGGVKYRIRRGFQVRFDFRTYMSPAPGGVFRTPFKSDLHGWLFDFVPMLGVSYLFGR